MKQLASGSFMLFSLLIYFSILKMERTCFFETSIIFKAQISVISQNTEHFISTAVGTSTLTKGNDKMNNIPSRLYVLVGTHITHTYLYLE
jgi:hypothetical protein